MAKQPLIKHAWHAVVPLSLLAGALTTAFYLTGALYAFIRAQPPGPVALIINAAVAGLLMFLGVIIVGTLSRPPRKGPFDPITDALQRIATGDFSIRLEESRESLGPVGELAQSVNDMAVKLDQMEKMRREFVSNVSHEIQSPLTSIRGFACALRQEDLRTEDRRHYLEIIESESLRLSKLSAFGRPCRTRLMRCRCLQWTGPFISTK